MMIHLNGHTMPTKPILIDGDMSRFSKVLSESPREVPSSISYAISPDMYNEYKTELHPRFFGTLLPADFTHEQLEAAAKELCAAVDNAFITSSFEYRDGGVPTGHPMREIGKIIVWVPLEVIPLPLSDKVCVRVIMNAHYRYHAPKSDNEQRA